MHTYLPTRNWRAIGTAAVLLAMLGAPQAMAGINGYTARDTFDAATAGAPSITTGFDAIPAGTLFAPGTGPAGSGFMLESTASAAFGEDPLVSDAFWATSGLNFLGSNNGDQQFLAGDSIRFRFDAPVSGFALYVIGGSDLWPGDMRLDAAGATVFNVDDASKLSDGNGSFAYFLGLAADDGSTFGTATLSGVDPGGGAFYVFAVDDVVVVTSPVPEPSMGLMLALGLAGISLWRWRNAPDAQSRRHDRHDS